MNTFPTPRELAEEGLRALREAPMTPQETWEFLIRHGIIDRNGRVLVNRYFPTDAPDETNGTPAPSDAAEKSEA
jgi:hypothetical protein